MKNITITINPTKLVRVTGDHGGYKTAECMWCGAIGWLDGRLGYSHTVKHDMVKANRLQHTKACPVSEHAAKEFRGD